MQLLNNGSDPLTVNADGSFTFATQLAAGSPYNVTVGTQPAGASCSVSAGSGTVAGAVSSVAVTCSPVLMKNIALFLDSVSGTILTYAYDAASGLLTPLAGPDVSSGAGANHILVDASATHAYTLTPGNSTGAPPRLAAFTIGLGGVLTANGVQTLTSNALDATLDVAGDTMYVLQAPVGAGQAATIMTYPIDQNTGVINARVGSAAEVPSTADLLYRNPVADYLYVIDRGTDPTKPGTVTAYAIGANSTNATTKQPTAVGVGVATGIHPTAMAIMPGGKFAYILNNIDETVSIYTVRSDGSLAPLSAGSPFGLPIVSPQTASLSAMTMDPNGQYLYINDSANNAVYQLKINQTDGTLSALSVPSVWLILSW
ncbi:6-phosphogluconolactonase [mine drainage metagenome]|uniref:6-phosphogluconolactonase n=1 Tax=mine drainage metagenome TaxID=410659 RepID=A0A1J5PHW5_9ZZZZ